MNITVLDRATLGEGIEFSCIEKLGTLTVYDSTKQEEAADRIKDSDVVILNKIKMREENLKDAKNLKLICVTATGYDNIDIDYCRKRGIAVCNVVGYSTDSVAQLTVALVLNHMMHISEYTDFVTSGKYTESGIANRLSPCFYELKGKTWGIVGMGNIGRSVAKVAEAFGCRVICTRRQKDPEYETLPLEKVMESADVVSVHLPLSEQTQNIIDSNMISKMKKGAVLVNVARGAVIDEKAAADAVKNERIYFATDVYSVEPLQKEHPFYEIRNHKNLILTPHMAWGAYEARVRCIEEIAVNITAFFDGKIRNRVDI